jgi:hypothetical protein
VAPDQTQRFLDLCAANGLPVAQIGVVDSTAGFASQTQVVKIVDMFTLTFAELLEAHTKTLPALFA